MLNGRIAPRRKALSALLISFLLVLVIPLAGLGVSYSYTNSAIRDEIFSSSRLSLNSAAVRADSAFQQLITTSQSVFGTELVLKTIGMQSREPEFYYDLPDVLRVLRAHEESIFDCEVLLYLHERQFVITGTTSNPARALGVALQLIRSSPYTADDFLDAMNTVSYAGRFDTSMRYSYRRPNTLQVTYIRTFTSTFRQLGDRDVTAFVSMPVDRLMELCGFSGEEDSVFLILDENDRVILHSSSKQEIPTNIFSSVSDEAERISVKLNGTAYLGTMTVSEVNGWKYALISPVTQFWARRDYVTHISIIAIAAALMTGLLLSVVLSRRNYRPIARTLDLISGGSTEGENEFELIQNAWLEMQSKKERIEHSLTTQNDMFRRHYLLSYIQGTDSMLPEPDMQSFLGIDTAGRRYALIGFMLAEGEEENERAYAMERDICFSRIEDLFARVFIGDCTGLNLQSAQIQTWLLIMDATRSEDFASMANEKLAYVLSEARTPAGMRVSALVTEPVDKFEDLRPAYANMLAFMEYQYVTSESGIVHISGQAGIDTADPARILAEALEAKRYADASSLLPTLIKRGEGLQTCRLSAMDLLYKLVVSAGTNHVSPADTEKAMQAVTQADSEEDVMRAMDCFLRRRCDVDTEDTAMIEARDELCPQLEEYIHAHYKDVNLSLGMIGEAFGLTPKYLSTLYKSRTGRSLLEFINAVRIEQAQKLLSVPGMTIAQAAEEVGYASVKTFRRAYVRAEGENPGKHKGE
jgi:AraC-like DNA-binding protein